ncbi:MAG: hypothetical protein HRF43_19505, partial [Phycisphaerae bacterium]
ELRFPGVPRTDQPPEHVRVDCNSPAHWSGDTLYMFYSEGHPYRSAGPDLFHLSAAVKTRFDNETEWNHSQQGPRWAEATYKAPDGRLYMWYHNEPPRVCNRPDLTAPRIGQMVSEDDGLNFRDQGLILEGPADALACDTPNKYFTGGNGDFCVNVDADRRYVYFFISTYNRNRTEQGVSVARMNHADLPAPAGKVFKWHAGRWAEPGLRGHVSPIFPGDWHRPDADAFWGPSVHWNHYLRRWVMLLNRAKDKDWNQEGIYVSFNADLADPGGWTPARKILDRAEFGPGSGQWYPQVVGLDAARRETDKLAGRRARLFIAGRSRFEIEFHRPGRTP